MPFSRITSPDIYPAPVRTYVVAGLAGALGAVVGAVLMLILKVGANRNCLDVFQQQVPAACAVPTAAPWAVALGALVGAVLAVGATIAMRHRS